MRRDHPCRSAPCRDGTCLPRRRTQRAIQGHPDRPRRDALLRTNVRRNASEFSKEQRGGAFCSGAILCQDGPRTNGLFAVPEHFFRQLTARPPAVPALRAARAMCHAGHRDTNPKRERGLVGETPRPSEQIAKRRTDEASILRASHAHKFHHAPLAGAAFIGARVAAEVVWPPDEITFFSGINTQLRLPLSPPVVSIRIRFGRN